MDIAAQAALIGTEIDHACLTYDLLGRPLVKDTGNARFTFGYDALDRLVSDLPPIN